MALIDKKGKYTDNQLKTKKAELKALQQRYSVASVASFPVNNDFELRFSPLSKSAGNLINGPFNFLKHNNYYTDMEELFVRTWNDYDNSSLKLIKDSIHQLGQEIQTLDLQSLRLKVEIYAEKRIFADEESSYERTKY